MTAVEKWRQELFNVFLNSDSEPSFQSNLLDKHTLWYCTCDTAKSEKKLLPWCPGFGYQKRKFFLLSSQIYEAYSYHGSNFSFFEKNTDRTALVVAALRTILLRVTGEEVYPLLPAFLWYGSAFSTCHSVPSSSSPFHYVTVIRGTLQMFAIGRKTVIWSWHLCLWT